MTGIGEVLRDVGLFACLYSKYDLQRYSENNVVEKNYRGCANAYLSDVSHLKQHLYRVHALPKHYCLRCGETFITREQSDAHAMTRPQCERKSEPSYGEWMSEDQYNRIRRRMARSKPSNSWYHIYDILFPGEPHPPSPYKPPFEVVPVATAPAAGHGDRLEPKRVSHETQSTLEKDPPVEVVSEEVAETPVSIYMHYTISQDRTGGNESTASAILAALGAREDRHKPFDHLSRVSYADRTRSEEETHTLGSSSLPGTHRVLTDARIGLASGVDDRLMYPTLGLPTTTAKAQAAGANASPRTVRLIENSPDAIAEQVQPPVRKSEQHHSASLQNRARPAQAARNTQRNLNVPSRFRYDPVEISRTFDLPVGSSTQLQTVGLAVSPVQDSQQVSSTERSDHSEGSSPLARLVREPRMPRWAG